MPAAVKTLLVEQGATYARLLTLKQADGTPLDLTGYTADGGIRTQPSAPTRLVDFTFEFVDPRSGGQLRFSLTAEQTAALPAQAPYRVGNYRINISDGTNVTRLLKGDVLLDPDV